jgi:hypothetical protein
MEDEDLRDLFAAFAMLGLIMSRGDSTSVLASTAYATSDAMIEAKYAKPDEGIASVKPSRKKRV